ncbi:MAG TPA: hypothetical protein DEO84_10270 [candidate division Zixibacteria bacterium]|nr:hypothetical protein [candidate division Zixibacteria bacterium]HBZ01690.1 hypothetical protein [candidate division Zixibacteria bacterium]
MRSSNRISFSDHFISDPHLERSWGGVFYHPAFIEPACEVLKLEGNTAYVTCDENQIGATNLVRRNRFPFRISSLPLLFQYFGPILFDLSRNAFVLEALDEFLSNSCDFAYLSFPPDIGSLDGLTNWKIIPNVTLALKEDGLKRWGADFKDDVKNKIRKATREKVEIIESDNLPRELWKTAYGRRGMQPPISSVALSIWCEKLVGASLLRIFTARIRGEDIAFRGELIYGKFAYDWIAGSSPAFHSSGANQLLMAEIGKELSALGISTWDMVGGEIPSIADFKRSFGAVDVPYFQASRAFGIKGKAFELLRKIRHGR